MPAVVVTLPVADAAASRRFVSGLGLAVDERISDPWSASVAVTDDVVVVLLERDAFGERVGVEVADPTAVAQVVLTLPAGSREEVDETLGRAVSAGAAEWGQPRSQGLDGGQGYGRGFRDPDGHLWEVLWSDPTALDGAGT